MGSPKAAKNACHVTRNFLAICCAWAAILHHVTHGASTKCPFCLPNRLSDATFTASTHLHISAPLGVSPGVQRQNNASIFSLFGGAWAAILHHATLFASTKRTFCSPNRLSDAMFPASTHPHRPSITTPCVSSRRNAYFRSPKGLTWRPAAKKKTHAM